MKKRDGHHVQWLSYKLTLGTKTRPVQSDAAAAFAMHCSDDEQASDRSFTVPVYSTPVPDRSTNIQELPSSVRGAPAHMRTAIRRRQNTEVRSSHAKKKMQRELI